MAGSSLTDASLTLVASLIRLGVITPLKRGNVAMKNVA
jgi:hypothetical protein